MSVNCPFCDKEQEINHDDGFGYDEGEDYEQECIGCEKVFRYSPTYLIMYYVQQENGDWEI